MGSNQAQSWSMPQVSIPGGIMGGSGDMFDNSFSDRMQRKKERKENQELIRARQIEVDARNEERYQTGLAVQAENKSYQRGIDKINQGYAAERHDWGEQTHNNNQTKMGWADTNQKNRAAVDKITLDTAQATVDGKDAFFTARNNVKTEQQQEIFNMQEMYAEQIANGTRPQSDLDIFNAKLDAAEKSGTTNIKQITDKNGYAAKLSQQLLDSGVAPAQVNQMVDDAMIGVSEQSALQAEKYKSDVKDIDEGTKLSIAENKLKQKDGDIDFEKVKKTIGADNLGNKFFGSYEGMSVDPKTGETIFKNGSKIGNKEIDAFLAQASTLKIPVEYTVNGKTKIKHVKPKQKEIIASLMQAKDSGGMAGALSDFLDGKVFDSALRLQIENRDTGSGRKSVEDIATKAETAKNKLYEKAIRKTKGNNIIEDILNYNQNANNMKPRKNP